MKSLVLGFALLAALLGPTESSGRETHVYSGKYSNYSDIIYTWNGKHLYTGKYAN